MGSRRPQQQQLPYQDYGRPNTNTNQTSGIPRNLPQHSLPQLPRPAVNRNISIPDQRLQTDLTASTNDAVVIDLTSPSTKHKALSPTKPRPRPGHSRSNSSVQTPRSRGSISISQDKDGGQGSSIAHNRPAPVNARHKPRLGFPSLDPTAPVNAHQLLSPTKERQRHSAHSRSPSSSKHPDLSLLKTIPAPSLNTFQNRQQASKSTSKSYQIEPPLALQPYPVKESTAKEGKDNKYADFFPWRGNHAEDTVSELAVRTGQYDKEKPGSFEHHSAKTTFTPIFKQNAGLATLSTIFLGVLEKRQNLGRITATHTFKPPPRVTLTGPKREGWLKDLATPTTPLRKLSRTIPHGLRGRDLLDECSAKEIPISRAIWFVRCVGANELRGLKRKGAGALAMGNEARWLREWTHQVIQFLEREMADCGKVQPTGASQSPNVWKKKMLYALRLATHLFSETLLDRYAFLEWFLTYLEASSLDRLPLAMLLLQTMWTHLVSYRRSGRRLSEALLAKAALILDSAEKDIYFPLMQRLCSYYTALLVHHPESLIIPKSWSKYEKTLAANVNTQNTAIELSLQHVISRNSALLLSKTLGQNAASHPQKSLIQAFDSATTPYHADDLAHTWMQHNTDPNLLVRTLVEWSVSPLRVGLHRVYLAVRVLRKWAKMGLEVQESIHDFLLSYSGSTRNKKHVFLFISELVRSKHFSTGKYMTWLISRGALMRCPTILDESEPVHVRLLAEIPVNNSYTTSTQRNLRANLLSQKGLTPNMERQSVTDTKELIESRIGGLFDKTTNPPDMETSFTKQELHSLRSVSRTAMSEVAFWLYNAVRLCVVEGVPVGQSNWKDLTVETGVSAVSLPQFLLIRRAFEEFEDFGLLAEVLKSVSNSDHAGVLQSAADTVYFHYRIFSALGIVDEVVRILAERYKRLQVRRNVEQRPLEQSLTRSLRNLIEQAGFEDSGFSLNDVQMQTSNTGTTPLPDILAELPQTIDAEHEEVEKYLAQAGLIDNDAFNRVFRLLIACVDKSFEGAQVSQSKRHSDLLAKLKQKDVAQYDKLIYEWLQQTINSGSRPTLMVALSQLIHSGAVDISTVVSIANETMQKASDEVGSIEAADLAELSFQAMDILLDDESDRVQMTEEESFTIRLERQNYRSKHGQTIVSVLQKGVRFCAIASEGTLQSRLEILVVSPAMLDLLRDMATSQFDLLLSNLVEPLSAVSSPIVSRFLHLLIDHLLDEHDSQDMTEADPDVQVAKLLQSSNDFSIRLCQLKMRLIFDSEVTNNKSQTSSANVRQSITEAFVESIGTMFRNRGSIWADLLSVLDQECVMQIRMQVEDLFLMSATFPRAHLSFRTATSDDGDQHGNGEKLARAILSVIESTAAITPSVSATKASAGVLADKVILILQSLPGSEGSVSIESPGNVHSTQDVHPDVAYRELKCWIVLFLRVVILHRAEVCSMKTPGFEQGRLILGLCSLLLNKYIVADEELFYYIFDTIGSLVDDAQDDVRIHMRRFVRKKQSSPHITYLLGGACDSAADWLKGVQRGRLVDYPLKPWEKLAEPTPFPGENDMSLNLLLFHARNVGCKSAMGGGAKM